MLGEYYEQGTDTLGVLSAKVDDHIAGTNGHAGDHDGRYYPRATLDTQANTPSGFVKLDVGGKIPSSLIPGNLDDVLGYSTLGLFPDPGEAGTLYIAKDTNYGYRWNGVSYTLVSSPLVLGETHDTAYRGDRGKIAYDHSLRVDNPHSVDKATIGLAHVDDTSDADKPLSTAVTLALMDKEPKLVNHNSAFNVDFGSVAGTVPHGNHNHDDVYYTETEIDNKLLGYSPIVTANTAYNKNFGTGNTDVARGDHTHTGYEQSVNKNVANGYAGLGADGKVPASLLPTTTGGSSLQVNGIDVDATDRLPNTVLLFNGVHWEYFPLPNFNNITPEHGAVFVVK